MKKLFSFILLLSLFLTCIPLCVTAGVDTVIPPEPKEIYFRSYFNGICDGLDTATTSNVSYDGNICLKVVPDTDSKNGYINLDGYSYTTLNIDITKYSTIVVVYKYVTQKPVVGKAQLRLMPQKTFSAHTYMNAREALVANRWAAASFDLGEARSTIKNGVAPIIKQMHLLPFGTIDVKNLNASDELYISKMYFFSDETGGAAYRKHYIEGTHDSNNKAIFNPAGFITRAEACTMISRILADSDRFVPAGDGESRFSDVSEHYALKYIEHLEDVGFLKSYTEKSFQPDKPVTKSEFLEFLVYLEGYIKSGILQDFSENMNSEAVFPRVTSPLSRAEAVVLINRILGRNPNEPFEQYKTRFNDVTDTSFAKNDIFEAALDHIAFFDENGGEYWARGLGNANATENFAPDYVTGNAKYNEVLELMNSRVEEIRNTPSESFDITGKTYYVSTDGSDDNDGLSEESPLKTARRASELALSGDLVLFERGCEWRERWRTKNGVTYSAYGYGAKPIFNGNTRGDAADPSLWTLIEGSTNVYKYAYKVNDIGNIVLNGTNTVTKYMPTLSGASHMLNGKVFDPATSMTSNNYFICIYDNVKDSYVDVATAQATLYFRCNYGNPGEYYNSIELCERGDHIRVFDNVHMDNIDVRYTGSHGFAMGTANNIKFTNCELSWIGGSAQYYNSSSGSMIRYGNGIEVYGSTKGFVIDNCYIWQCYDAGVTHQFSAGGTSNVVHENVSYTNNVIDKCIYNIEYFMGAADEGSSPDRYMKNILYKGNILSRSGTGWGYYPSRSGSIVGWDHHRNEAENFVIEDNIFFADNYNCFIIAAEKEEWLPTFRNNTYIRRYNANFAKYGIMNQTVQYKFMGNVDDILEKIIEEENSKVYYFQ